MQIFLWLLNLLRPIRFLFICFLRLFSIILVALTKGNFLRILRVLSFPSSCLFFGCNFCLLLSLDQILFFLFTSFNFGCQHVILSHSYLNLWPQRLILLPFFFVFFVFQHLCSQFFDSFWHFFGLNPELLQFYQIGVFHGQLPNFLIFFHQLFLALFQLLCQLTTLKSIFWICIALRCVFLPSILGCCRVEINSRICHFLLQFNELFSDIYGPFLVFFGGNSEMLILLLHISDCLLEATIFVLSVFEIVHFHQTDSWSFCVFAKPLISGRSVIILLLCNR